MIQVQIASQVTPTGVLGTRWVLVDDADLASSPAPATAPQAAAPPDGLVGERGLLSLGLKKLLVAALGLALAWWSAQLLLGSPTVRWLAPTVGAAPGQRALPAAVAPPAVAPPMPEAPAADGENPAAAQPAPPAAPAAASAAAQPLITAQWR